MKKLKILLALITITVLLSCDTDRDDMELSAAEAMQLNQMVQDGEWQITQFLLNGSDRTALYENYVFVFEEQNNLSANSSVDRVTGTWRVSNDSGSEFDSYNDVDFNIFFASNGKLGELTRNYDVVSATTSIINLDLEMNENGDTATLVFSKN